VANKKIKYSTAFSAGSLLLKESEVIIHSIKSPEDFMKGEEKATYDDLPVNSEASKKRYGNEVTKRLLKLEDAYFIHKFNEGSKEDKLLILFYAACKTYRLITDFMLEVVLDKWYHLDYEVGADDFKNFLYRQMDKHAELENLTPYTITKRSSIVIRMLKECGLIKNGKLQKNEYNPSILRKIVKDGDSWFLEVLLMNETDRKEIIE